MAQHGTHRPVDGIDALLGLHATTTLETGIDRMLTLDAADSDGALVRDDCVGWHNDEHLQGTDQDI